ncbi:MAG: thiol-disulfide interchange like [Planctomycetota bacterium]|nr:MAG: thiol-disulfide interchange like [Planctomycetota bacterium]
MRRFALLPLLALSFVLPSRAEEAPDDDYAMRVAAGKDQYLNKGNMYRATWEFREAMRLAPEKIEAYRGMGMCLVKRGDRERGIFYLHESRRRKPDDGLTHFWLGIAYTNDQRSGLALHHLKLAKGILKATHFPDEKAWKAACDTMDKWLPAAEKAGGAKFDASNVGPPARLMLEYAANLYGDSSQLNNASVAAGQGLVKDLILVQAWDSDWRVIDPAKVELKWSCSPGLTARDGSFFAGDKPGKETVFASDAGGRFTASASVTVLGPAVKLLLVPETATIAQNQRQPFEVRAVDAAGNSVLAPSLQWTVSEGAGLARPATEQDAEGLFEPHRNSYEAPEGATAGSVKVSVASADGALKAVATVTIEKRKMDKLQSRAKAVSWENLTLDEAMKKAALTNKPLLVEITAGWCPFCKKFEEGPLSDERVGAALKDWLAVQVDADQHPELVERYSVDDLPMIALLSPRGSLAGGFGNNLEPLGIDPRTTTDAFLKALVAGKDNAPKIDEEETRRLTEPKDAAKMEALARWFWDKKRWKEAEKWAREAILADAKRGDGMEPFVVWSMMSFGQYDEALKEADTYLAAHADSTAAAQLTFYRGMAFLRQKMDDKARAVFADVQKKWPTSVWARKAAQAGKK